MDDNFETAEPIDPTQPNVVLQEAGRLGAMHDLTINIDGMEVGGFWLGIHEALRTIDIDNLDVYPGYQGRGYSKPAAARLPEYILETYPWVEKIHSVVINVRTVSAILDMPMPDRWTKDFELTLPDLSAADAEGETPNVTVGHTTDLEQVKDWYKANPEGAVYVNYIKQNLNQTGT